MENEVSKHVGIAITISVGIILLGSLLVPVLTDIDYGRTTYNNNQYEYMTYTVSDSCVDFDLEFYNGGIRGTMDGVSVDFPIKSRENYIFCSDKAVFIEGYASGASLISGYGYFFNELGTAAQYVSTSNAVGGHLTFDAKTKTIEFNNGNIHYSAVVDWLYHIDPHGAYRSFQTTGPWYANINDLVVAGGGNYTTGENDTTYSYYVFNEKEVITSGPYAGKLNVSSETVAQDIVKCTLTVDIGGESFTPWNVIIPVKVTSTEHSDWENVLHTIPVILIVALLGLAVHTVRNKDN